MKEIEVKILDIDRKKIEKKLRSLGAKKIFDGRIDARFFDFKNMPVKRAKNHFRLRKEGNTTKLTFKVHVSKKKAKINKEYEVEVSDFETMKAILELLGLHVWKRMTKRRISYMLKGTRFEIDRYAGKYSFIPEFLEIEAKDIKTIYRYAKLLGFRKEDCRPWTASDLRKYYARK